MVDQWVSSKFDCHSKRCNNNGIVEVPNSCSNMTDRQATGSAASGQATSEFETTIPSTLVPETSMPPWVALPVRDSMDKAHMLLTVELTLNVASFITTATY